MIIKNLTLNNFRVFRGTHDIELAPDNSEKVKPIILIGGLNGSGKTSILTAVRLALYGRLAFNDIHNEKDYAAQLTSFIHNDVDVTTRSEEASINLVFTYNKEGVESEFSVIRSWKREQKDKLILLQDGNHLSELNYEQCQGFLNELIPHGIADLFFFDGEKIASLAEDESGKVLQIAVRRLLGLDLVAKLRNDLSIYLKRQDAEASDLVRQGQIAEIEEQSKNFGQSAENFRFAADLKKISLDLIAVDIRKQEQLLSAQGGAFALTKAQEKNRVDELLREKIQLEKSIRHEFEGALPFALAPKALKTLMKQLNKESNLKKTAQLPSEFKQLLIELERYENYESQDSKNHTIKVVNDLLQRRLSNNPTGSVLLDISEREFGGLDHAINSESHASWKRFEKARDNLSAIEFSLDQAAANIERAPEDEQLLDIFQSIRILDKKYQAEQIEYKLLLSKARQALQKQLEFARQLQKLRDKERTQYNSNIAVINATNTLAMLDKYAESLTLARVQKLEDNFVQAYHRLARKDDLQISARINATTFDVELVDELGMTINRKLLSAGEKQIYAIAILDALAKTSGRELPVIIDTPLGRLDSHHRDRLINNYFPYASHQVVLLSTDTEVGEHYYISKLKPHISHTYQICFNSESKSASLRSGYFWSDDQRETF